MGWLIVGSSYSYRQIEEQIKLFISFAWIQIRRIEETASSPEAALFCYFVFFKTGNARHVPESEYTTLRQMWSLPDELVLLHMAEVEFLWTRTSEQMVPS